MSHEKGPSKTDRRQSVYAIAMADLIHVTWSDLSVTDVTDIIVTLNLGPPSF